MIQAEQNVIGALLMDSSLLSKVRHKLTPEMFTDKSLGKFYEEFVKGADEKRTVDHMFLMQKFSASDAGADYIRDILESCLDKTISSAVIESAADAVLKEYQAARFSEVITHARASPGNIREQLINTVNELQSIEIPDISGITLRQMAEATKDYYFRDREIRVTKFGIPKLDEVVRTLEPGDITVVAARPSVGKSAFVIQVAANLSEQGKRVALFSLEMSMKQVFERFMAHIGGLSMDRIRFGKYYTGDEESRHKKALEWLEANQNIIIYADGKESVCPRGVSGIEAACQSQDVDVAIIDYLQLLVPEKRYNGNKAAEVGEISASTKRMAMRLGIHVINLCQLNRGSEYRSNKRPMLADLRDSGAIEQDASNVIFLWNVDSNDKTKKGCAVEKQRQGSTGEMELTFDGKHMRFVGDNEFVEVDDESTPFD